jgi:hypothetical protein
LESKYNRQTQYTFVVPTEKQQDAFCSEKHPAGSTIGEAALYAHEESCREL